MQLIFKEKLLLQHGLSKKSLEPLLVRGLNFLSVNRTDSLPKCLQIHLGLEFLGVMGALSYPHFLILPPNHNI
jgi:hypothetical protein